jgi:nucleotidyltransferase substrate binding protein (TIGR01987 family)
MSTKPRWKFRFNNYAKAYQRLAEAVTRKKYDDLEAAGLIQAFAFTFELGWKTLKDLLVEEGFDIKTPRQTIKQAFQSGFIKDGKLWLEVLDKGNIMAHTYDEQETNAAIKLIKNKYFPLLRDLYLLLEQK